VSVVLAGVDVRTPIPVIVNAFSACGSAGASPSHVVPCYVVDRSELPRCS